MELIPYFCLVGLGLVAVVGSLLPIIPGLPIFAIALMVYGFWDHFEPIWITTSLAVLFSILGIACEYATQYLATKALQGSKYAAWGAVLGSIAGITGTLPLIFFAGPIWGAILGAIIGALFGQYLWLRQEGTSITASALVKPALGTLIGAIAGNLLKALLAALVLLSFCIEAYPF